MKTGWKKTIAPLVLVLGAVALAACGGSDNKTDSGAAAGTDAAAPAAGTLLIGTDLPLQGASADASADTNLAIKLLLEKVGSKAGTYSVGLKEYDDSTAAKGAWDDATCTANANSHVGNKAEVAVMGTYNSGCAKLEVPILNQDPAGPMLMISHANTNPGLTKAWDPGEPDKYYPAGTRNYGRIIATDDFQGTADAEFAAKELGVKNCYVLNDAQTYGQGVAKAFVDAAAKVGITIIANDAWDAKQTNYTALFEKVKSKNPDCVYFGGINDNNGQQLIKDKVKVLGPNDGAVKLIGPDGFTGYPEVQKMPEAQGMYISFAGIPSGELVKQGGFGGTFVTDFKTKYGHDPASSYSIYGAAATQLILAAIAKSDGTRKGVTEAAFSGITIPADQSILGKEFGIDPTTGDVTVKDMSFNIVKDNAEVFLKPWQISG
jgi:branched-chain amino acid transport system substrate-binding protein